MHAKTRRMAIARHTADAMAGVLRAKGFKKTGPVDFTRTDADLSYDAARDVWRVTVWKTEGRDRLVVFTVRENGRLQALANSFF